jgi:hypothetical protein
MPFQHFNIIDRHQSELPAESGGMSLAITYTARYRITQVALTPA